ncbi:MAG TPA: LLM class flavin-dependent oxidoreductase [Acidimicrobiales bacterium]|nr:LLM class flavin-dependent oxidoreductase [Acidimicrobiales bacterium]
MRFGVGIPVRLDPSTPRDPLRETFRWCARAEELGFDFATVAHHRFTAGYNASPWVVLAAIAARTSTIRLGTGIFLLPLDHPLDVAEEVATLDQVSGGRAFLGAGLGYRRYEWDALQLPYERRGTRMTEALDIVQRAWTDDRFGFHGEHFSFDEVDVLPKPVQRPRPPVWVGANTPPAVRRAARLADAWMVGFGDRLSVLGPHVAAYRTEAAAHGRAGEVCLLRLVGIGPSRAQVEHEWLPGVLAMLRSYRRAGAPGERDERASRRLRTDGGHSTLADLGDEMLIAGTPDDVIAAIRRCGEVTGCEHVIPTFGGPDPLAAMELFGREVIPAFPAT